jgi:hypothetical protein
MRTAITLGYPHEGGTPVLVAGPEVPIRKQRDALKEVIRRGKFHPGFHTLEIWESDSGCVKYIRRLPKAEKEEPARPPKKPRAEKPKVKST